ncbi:HAMP domain-containing sensor histidine kinase [Streptomyces sp. MnatMP-M17]|uniref:sensor histidine kinase n=1 Tax=unclassified Streptomyces TaxID=2593676 RepID=UPI00081E27B0|nr:HAMP domain-containing sensor histidine kinase [Streptomyces sp. MnatMP-M17]SCF89290.1 two-component system, OmpR family, sensor histidine kinase BaeS [Streptomyces sp. MnatMP-M17]
MGRGRLRLPLRKSLLGRLLTVSVLVASCSVAATAWLAVQTTSGAIRQQQGQNLSSDAKIYNTLLGYAATHPGWEGVGGTVRELARQSQRRIALTTQDRRLLFDSLSDSSSGSSASSSGSASNGSSSGKSSGNSSGTSSAAPLPAQASAVVDPLSVDTVLVPDATSAGADRVDPRAVGPFLLPAKERADLRQSTARSVECLNRVGIAADIVESPSGRPRVQFVSNDSNDTDRSMELKCLASESAAPTTTEKKALHALNQLADACLKRQGRTGVKLNLDLSWDRGWDRGHGQEPTDSDLPAVRPATEADIREATIGKAKAAEAARASEAARAADEKAAAAGPSAERLPAARDSGYDRAIASCVGSARREQLTAYVAAPALLFIDDPGAVSVPGFDLSPANTARIVGVTALVLALTVGASVIAGARLVRPLHALTGAAQRMRDGLDSAPVPVGPDNEIGRLAAAFNDMAVHRARLEEQRKVMVSDVAHELRTPLSNIRGWLEAAQDGLAEPDPAFVSSLLEEAVQLQHIIDDLQDLGAADAGALRLHLEPVYVADLLGQVAAAHQGLAETAGVTLAVSAEAPEAPDTVDDVDTGRPTLYADPVRLRQAVSNLVSNAVRHTPPGGTVTLRSYVTDSGDEVVVEVSDTGSGIPADDVPHVFDRFWRAEKSRNRSTGGSGLGLAIVLKLAEAHGGTASVVSTEGQGSVFTLRLPAAPSAEEAGETQETGQTGQTGEKTQETGGTTARA